jgi:hypothetical protein
VTIKEEIRRQKKVEAPPFYAKERDAGFCSHIKDVGKIRKGRRGLRR